MADKRKNIANYQHELYRKLTKLFSGPISTRRQQAPRHLKRYQLDKFSSRIKSTSGQEFKKAMRTPWEQFSHSFYAECNRHDRYVDFSQMEFSPILSSALDIYADEMTTSSALREMLTIKCTNQEIKHVLSNLYFNIMNVEYNLFGWCRSLCKFGDFFLYLDIEEKEGIRHVIGLPTEQIERLEGEDKQNPDYVQFQWNSAGLTLENWQMLHFRILGNDKFAPYGQSCLDSARRIWRQLVLLEDSMMAYRVIRSSERRVFYVDVAGINPQDVPSYMEQVMTQMKRNKVVDSETGRVDLRYNPLSVEEDYYIPVKGESGTKIETLAGGANTTAIDDVKYMRSQLFAAIKIPGAYLSADMDSGGGGGGEDKTTLSQKDIRFARTIQRIQKVVISELEKAGIIHLFTLGFRGDDLTSFSLSLNNPSVIAELQELERWKSKFDVASAAVDGMFSKRWIATNLLGLSNEEFQRMQLERFYDKKLEAAIEVGGESAAMEGSPLGAGGGDMAMPDPGAGADVEAPPEPDEGALPVVPPGEAQAFRSVQQLRNMGQMARAGLGQQQAKPSQIHMRGVHRGPSRDAREDAGGRARSLQRLGNTRMDYHNPNMMAGQEFRKLAQGMMEESQDSIYTEEENGLQSNSKLIRLLQEKMEKKANHDD